MTTYYGFTENIISEIHAEEQRAELMRESDERLVGAAKTYILEKLPFSLLDAQIIYRDDSYHYLARAEKQLLKDQVMYFDERRQMYEFVPIELDRNS